MKESTIEQKVCRFALDLGWLVYKLTSQTTRGLPDRIFLREGCLFFIEFKAPGEQPTKFQKHIIKKIIEQGFDVYVIDSIKKGYDLLKSYEK